MTLPNYNVLRYEIDNSDHTEDALYKIYHQIHLKYDNFREDLYYWYKSLTGLQRINLGIILDPQVCFPRDKESLGFVILVRGNTNYIMYRENLPNQPIRYSSCFDTAAFPELRFRAPNIFGRPNVRNEN